MTIYTDFEKKIHPVFEEENKDKRHDSHDGHKDESIYNGSCKLCASGIIILHQTRFTHVTIARSAPAMIANHTE